MIGICRGCNLEAQLLNSHAIPNSTFKRVFKTYSGKAFASGVTEKKLRHSSESGAGPLLCKECEEFLNKNFDRPAQDALQRVKRGELIKGTETDQLVGFILSVIWRASELDTSFYKEFSLGQKSEGSRAAIFHRNYVDIWNRFSYRVATVADEYINCTGAILSPSLANYDLDRVEIYFLMDGFLLSLVSPPLRKIDLQKHGFIRKAKSYHVNKIPADKHALFDAFIRVHLQTVSKL